MSVQCPKCFAPIPLSLGERLPPWCPKCGNDVKPEQFIPVAAQPYEPPVETFSAAPSVVTTMTGTGPKGWLKNHGDGVPKAAPPQPESPAPLEHEPLPETTPQPLVSPADEARNGLLKAAGIVLLLVAAGMAANTRSFIKNGRETTGTVEIVSRFAPGAVIGWRGPSLVYVVNGKTYDGETGGNAVGSTVPIVYEVSDPKNIRPGTPRELYLGSVIVAFIGGGLIAVSLLASNALTVERERAYSKPDDF